MKAPVCLHKILLLALLLLWPLYAQSNPSSLAVNSKAFKLTQDQAGNFLEHTSGVRILLPQQWLYPKDEVKEDGEYIVTSFNYDEEVSTFPIGNGLTGVHLSSYQIQKEGSASAAAGRDIFLIVDLVNKRTHNGNLMPGVTKGGVRSMGCFHAHFHDFVVQDVNSDGLTDIGVIAERIWCEEHYSEKKELDVVEGPFYRKDPIKWYLFNKKSWKYEKRYDGKDPRKEAVRLPLIGLGKSPVEFVKEVSTRNLIRR